MRLMDLVRSMTINPAEPRDSLTYWEPHSSADILSLTTSSQLHLRLPLILNGFYIPIIPVSRFTRADGKSVVHPPGHAKEKTADRDTRNTTAQQQQLTAPPTYITKSYVEHGT